jgi:Na+/H+ antiporter NhaD/arsenite permease-like protein
MACRQFLGLYLGFIAVTGMIILVLITEIFGKKLDSPSFEQVITDLDWRALIFYIVLFILVGGIDHVGLIKALAEAMAPFFKQNLVIGGTILYWVTAPIVGIVEHDAYILAFLYLIRDLAASAQINPWPLWWLLLWAGTLGSNLTVAGAPALYVAQSVCEKEDTCRIGVGEFLSYSVSFAVISLAICFIFAMVVWVFPFAF